MNIKREASGKLTEYITIELEPNDYNDSYQKELKAYSKKIRLDGFRNGMVPVGVVKKMYGKSILAEEINKISAEAFQKYLEEQKIDILFRALPAKEDEDKLDFDNPQNFVLHFEVALKPQFELSLGKVKSTRYSIKIENDELDDFVKDLKRRYGNSTKVEAVSEKSAVLGSLTELDENKNEKEGGIDVKAARIFVADIDKKATAKDFIGKKIEESVEFELKDLLKDYRALANLLRMSQDELKKIKSNTFRFKINEINDVEEAELNEELYNKAFPGKEIKDETALRQAIVEEYKKYHSMSTDRKFMNDTIDELLENTSIELPDDFIKRYLRLNENGVSEEIMEKEYPQFVKTIKWQLIESKIIEEKNISISNETIRDYYRDKVLSQYFMGLPTDEETKSRMDKVIDSMMQNQEEVKRVYDAIMDEKMIEVFSSDVKFKEKEVSYEEFVALLNK